MQCQTTLLKGVFFGSAALFMAFGLWMLLTSNYTSMAGAMSVALGCAIMPLALLSDRDLPVMRAAFTWNFIGITFLLIWRFSMFYTSGNTRLPYFALISVFIFHARMIREMFYPQAREFGIKSLFSPQSMPAENLRSAYEEQIRQAAGQEERNRLARDLHDSIKQMAVAFLQAAAPEQDLSPREIDVLRQMTFGRSNKEIAEALAITEETVKTHIGRLLGKLHLENRTQAVVHALKNGLVSIEELK